LYVDDLSSKKNARHIDREHPEPIEADVQVYALEEVIAEKLRAILVSWERIRIAWTWRISSGWSEPSATCAAWISGGQTIFLMM